MEHCISDHALLCLKESEQNPTNISQFKFLNIVMEGFLEVVLGYWRIPMIEGAMYFLWKKLQRLQP